MIIIKTPNSDSSVTQSVSYDASHGFNLTPLRRSARLAAKVPVAPPPPPKKEAPPKQQPTTEETLDYVAKVQLRFDALSQVPQVNPERVALIIEVFEAVMAGAGNRVVAYNPNLRTAMVGACHRICEGAYPYDTGQPWLMPPLHAIENKLMNFIISLRHEDCFRPLF